MPSALGLVDSIPFFLLPGYDDNILNDQVLELQPVNLLLVQHLTIHILKIGNNSGCLFHTTEKLSGNQYSPKHLTLPYSQHIC